MPSAKSAPRQPLSYERIVDAAMTLADASPFEIPTMRALAAALGVQPMSLYHHVPGKEQLVDAMIDRVYSEIDVPSRGEWRTRLRRRYRSARAVLMRHPWAVALMESRATPGPHTLAQHDYVLGVLLDAGFSMRRTAQAYSVLDAYLYGFVLQEIALPFESAEDIAPMAQEMLAAFPAEAYPNMAAFMAGHVMRPGYDYSAEFDPGLDLLLDALGSATGR